MFNKKNTNEIEMIDFEKEAKKRERQQKFDNAVNKVKETAVGIGRAIYDNREIVVPIVTVGVPAMIGLSKQLGRWHDRIAENKRINKQFYDRSLGKYWTVDRRLSSRQLKEIARRKSDGEKYADIFNNMGIKFH